MTMSAQEIARNAAIADAEKPAQVGKFISVDIDRDNRVSTFLFEADLAGYQGMALVRHCCRSGRWRNTNYL
jgi:hypothetical protein